MKYLHFVLKSLTRNRVRTILTTLSVVVAFVLFGMLQAVHSAFTTPVDPATAERLVTRSKIPTQQLPFRYVDKIRQLDGVKAVTYEVWFGAYYQEPRNWIGVGPVNPVDHPQVYTGLDMSDKDLRAWQNNRIGAVVGREMMQRFGWKVGDRIPLISVIYSHDGGDYTWEFEIVGTFDDKRKVPGSTNYMHFRYDYFNETRDLNKDKVGWITFVLDDPKQAAEISKKVDAMFANSAAETETSTQQAAGQSFMKQFADIDMIVNLILTAVFFTMLLISGNTMAEAVRERTGELAVLKTIGFSNRTTLMLVLAESIAIALIGCALGLLIACGLILIGAIVFNGLSMSLTIAGQALIAALLFGILAGALPAWQAGRLNIVNALARQ